MKMFQGMKGARGRTAKPSEAELKKLIQGGETNTIELKVAAPRATKMAERLCGLANAQGGLMIIGDYFNFFPLVVLKRKTAIAFVGYAGPSQRLATVLLCFGRSVSPPIRERSNFILFSPPSRLYPTAKYF